MAVLGSSTSRSRDRESKIWHKFWGLFRGGAHKFSNPDIFNLFPNSEEVREKATTRRGTLLSSKGPKSPSNKRGSHE
eukprot:scaffold12163_cov176-Amphora_coffeaeformis.AAC.15